jgi:hypothetical protein
MICAGLGLRQINKLMPPQRDLLLIAGIPGTGKTWYGDRFAEEFGFAHYDLEKQQMLDRLAANPAQFIADIVSQNRDAVVTWGFRPDDAASVSIVLQFKTASFKLIWFDGNRPAALREFIKRGTVPEILFYLQMYRIEVDVTGFHSFSLGPRNRNEE